MVSAAPISPAATEALTRLSAVAAASVTTLAGIGPAAAELLAARGVSRVVDMPWLFPVGYDDWRHPFEVDEVVAAAHGRGSVGEGEGGVLGQGDVGDAAARPFGSVVVVRGVVRSAAMLRIRGRPAARVVVVSERHASDRGSAELGAFWFFAAHGVLALAKPGRVVLLAGKVSPGRRPESATMAHPRILADEPSARDIRPRYPRGIPAARVARAILVALERLSAETLDPVPPEVARRESMPPLMPRLLALHRPTDTPSPALVGELRARLAWAEAFTLTWDRSIAVENDAAVPALPLPWMPAAVERLELELGFQFTGAQRRAIGEIGHDLAEKRPMRRLLFGDVGSGKTAVALAAAAQAVAAGAQVAILAPTSILAEQYLEAAAPLTRSAGARITLLTSGGTAKGRQKFARALALGSIDIVVGTHALLQEGVTFHNLGLVVVDEQQRLGVAQRLALVRKGEGGRVPLRPHLLTLSATPIPRSLALAVRGELPTSLLDERPAGRQEVATEIIARANWEAEVVPAIAHALDAGGRVFVVCPRIGGEGQGGRSARGRSDSSGEDAGEGADGGDDAPPVGPSCIDRAANLAATFGAASVACVHGAEHPSFVRERITSFRNGQTPLLVGTTVIEVGIDVPEATLMVIDGADYFGLAQLHQLRGRVGRGTAKSRCLLVHDAPGKSPAGDERVANATRDRLEVLCRHANGLDIAREDLRLRGAGELSGTRQSGQDEGLVYLDPLDEPPWLERIDEDVRRLRESDPALEHHDQVGLRLAMDRVRRVLAIREEAG